MTTIKGIYENGQIKLLEMPPVQGTNKVLITFIEEDEEKELQQISLHQSSNEFQEYLEEPREDLYQEYLKK